MEMEALMQTLQAHPFLEGFRKEQLEKLAAMAVEARFAKDQTIFREGDESSFFYLLVSGKVALEASAPGRATIRISTLGEGDELGWSSVTSPVRKQFTARSLGTVRAIAFDGARLLEACERDPEFGYTLMRRVVSLVAERLQATRMQLIDMYGTPGAKA